ncbi:hypothetical protein [Catenulispora acidiphila]|uniref:hypothetical protein n=1 Tax=Catenulispora acidiphila TaxID=304895 RepID=UPI00019DFF42|nr:hypothetical protein [Catenulispora acidiphila]
MPLQLGLGGRLRAALHVLRSGDYQPASAYLCGVRDGLDQGLDMAWSEMQRRFPELGPAPHVPANSCVSLFPEP